MTHLLLRKPIRDGYTSFDADRAMGSRSLFRSTSSIAWYEHQKSLDLKQSFIIMNRIDSDEAAKLILTAYGVNEPVYRVENYVFSIVWRKNIYREWLFAQFMPLVQWSRTDDFDATPGIALQLEMTIGETN